MLKSYFTVKEYGSDTLIIKKSEFISYVRHVENDSDAKEFITSIKKKHYNATHNCFAYVIGKKNEIQKSSDDGEPSGTAGKPILELIKKLELKDTVIVVTRYYGGIQLGAGGLIRAYGSAAKAGIIATGVVERVLYSKVTITTDYNWYGKIENEMNNRGYKIYETSFLDNVSVIILSKFGEEEKLVKLLQNLTNGQGKISGGDNLYVDNDVEVK